MLPDRSLTVDDIPGAKPKIRHHATIEAMKLDSELDQPIAVFQNRNVLANGDIIGLTNPNPMIDNVKLKPSSKRLI